MPWPTIDNSNFTGAIKISQVAADSTLSNVIGQYYPETARLIVGAADYAIIEALPDPMPQKYIDLLNGSTYVIKPGKRKQAYHGGVINAIEFALYFQYESLYYKGGTQGLVKNNTDVASTASTTDAYAKATWAWNVANTTSKQVCKFVFAHSKREYAIDSYSGTGTVTVNLSDTQYMADGDTVNIGNVDYTISNLVPDTSFEITAATAPNANSLKFTAFPNYLDYNQLGVIV